MENKTSKYFKYAIGEIILVVIGILIALQINNWNEARKERQQEQELLSQLYSEFRSNLAQLDQKIELRNNMINAALNLLHDIDNPESRNIDSIYKNLGYTGIAPTFDPIVNDINSSGRIQLLQNNVLKEKLSRWTSEIIQVTEEEQAWLRYRDNYYRPSLFKHGAYRNIINRFWNENTFEVFTLDKNNVTEFNVGKSKSSVDLDELLEQTPFENHIVQCASYAKITNIQSLSLRNRIIEIIELIEQDLK
jgi:hypothetical protein